ncbi:protein transport protein HofC [Enterobacter sp. CC120223-11]|uniref:protein transport protein HofC n=1 Tax=Enterobacter sp. CC120223-11 TaxID=1378073 RepID=UPI000BD08844|nr:protein transport protein HofC [Enterobacter sp. CC120223-11]SNY69106.1 protein transport protein HofC [Enterobacter sp. CC120223-11]
MPDSLWHWRGVTEQGEAREGSVRAESKIAAMALIGQEGVYPLAIKRKKHSKSQWRKQYNSELIKQLSTLLKAGLTLTDSLMLLAEQHPSPQWQALMQDLARQLAQGQSLSTAMQQWPEAFPPLYPAMIQAGEMTGKLDYCCAHLARQQEEQHRLSQKVKKALRYPLIILSLAVLVVIGMCGFVLPEFAAIYRTFNTPLPLLTRLVMSLADIVQQGWPLIFGGVALPFILRPLLQRSPGWQKLRPQVLLKLPVVSGLIRGQMLSQIYTVLALTQNAGIPFLQGLECVEKTLSCPWWRRVIEQMSVSVASGSTIWQAMEKQSVFTPLCKQLVRTGEASGALDAMLDNLSHYHSGQTHQQADNLATLLEPIMLLVTGVIIGTLVVAMYLPVFQLGDAISGG